MTESTNPDILALEAVIATLLNPPSAIVEKDVVRRDNGHIARVVERHLAFDAAAELQRGARLIAQLNAATLSQLDSIAYGQAYARFMRAAVSHASPESVDGMLTAGARMRDAAVHLARQPGNHA